MIRRTWKLAALALSSLAVGACGGSDAELAAPQAASGSLATATNAWVFRDALVSPWIDSSWAQHNLANTSPVAAGLRSISVKLGPWQGLYFRRGPVSASGFAALVLQVMAMGDTVHAVQDLRMRLHQLPSLRK